MDRSPTARSLACAPYVSHSCSALARLYFRQIAVELFLSERLGYLDIMPTVEQACEAHRAEFVEQPTYEEIIHYDSWARDWVKDFVTGGKAVVA